MPDKKRIREWVGVPGNFPPGKKNSITDVPGVKAGHFTIHDDRIHTGITLISPHDLNAFENPVPCAVYSGNGFGKLAGSMQIDELGILESMIGLTNTLSVPMVMQGLIGHYLENNNGITSINVVVGETNDSALSDIGRLAIRPDHVKNAINALSADVPEGAVGAGAGTCCFGYKGGIGTASRAIPAKFSDGEKLYTMGVIVQTNFSGNLNIYGRPVPCGTRKKTAGGSCMIIIATDAPVDARQLKRIAKRGIAGMTQTGSFLANGSGDFCIAFSNYPGNIFARGDRTLKTYSVMPDDLISPLFEAVCDAVREAIYNSLTMADTITGRDGVIAEAIDMEKIIKTSFPAG